MLNVRVRATVAKAASRDTTQTSDPILPQFEVDLEGDITDGSDLGAKFTGLPLPPGAILRVHCSQVRYINSIGVKQWVLLFEGYRVEGARLTFHGCSPAIVSQLNLMGNFIRKDEIESLQLPFLCPNCQREQLIERTVAELKPEPTGAMKLPEPPCESCATPLAFDENPVEYLHFLD